MFRKIDNHKYTASVSNAGLVVVMYDDGWENLISSKFQYASKDEGRVALLKTGYEEFDPNADLKAQGFVWNGYCYAKP